MLTFVHLSDIHFERGLSDESAFDLDRPIRQAILLDAKQYRKTFKEVRGILVTGDIAYAGKASEYGKAVVWLAQLAGELGCGHDDVWCVPGNHDVDRSVLKELSAGARPRGRMGDADWLQRSWLHLRDAAVDCYLRHCQVGQFVGVFTAQDNC